jgi:hypothetical protein
MLIWIAEVVTTAIELQKATPSPEPTLETASDSVRQM